MTTQKDLEQFYVEVAGVAQCSQCKGATTCCDEVYCKATIDFAKEEYGITLQETGHKYPLLGPDGCTAAPHLRPVCALHNCDVAAFGALKGKQPSVGKRYWKLRDRIGKEDHMRLVRFANILARYL